MTDDDSTTKTIKRCVGQHYFARCHRCAVIEIGRLRAERNELVAYVSGFVEELEARTR